MEKYNLTNELNVFGIQVKTFPNGIGEAFGGLMRMIQNGDKRSYYGLSRFDGDGNILYYATAEEILPGEAEKYNCTRYSIEKGEYLTEPLHSWREKTDCIKDIFHRMMQDDRIDKNQLCVEWYKTDDEMWCMIRTTTSQE